jgi:hypothetical protein
VTVGVAAGRVAHAERSYDPSIYRPEPDQPQTEDQPTRVWPRYRPAPTPMFSSNDRSRWATVRALVDEGTFAIGKRVPDPEEPKGYRDEGIIFEDGYQSVDKVKNPQTDEFFSTKPPLYPVMVAGEYWVLKELFGLTLADQPFTVVRIVLVTFNVLPLAIYLLLLARLLERYGRSDWGRLFVFACACFATYVTSFAITLTDHTPAAYTALFAVYPLLRSDRVGGWGYAVSGFFAGLTACFELFAAPFAALLGLVLLFRKAKLTLFAFLPFGLLPVGAFLYTNHLAVGDVVPIQLKFGTGEGWYEYEGGYWKPPEPDKVPRGIDWAGYKETKEEYALHTLVGHHGIFSLTPVWLLILLPVLGGGPRRETPDQMRYRILGGGPPGIPADDSSTLPWAALRVLTIVVTLVMIGLYLWKTDNYSGWTSGPRRFFWLTPLWLLSVLPAADFLGRYRVGRGIGYVLLLASAVSANYSLANPFRHPWIYDLCELQGWVRY